MLRRLFHEALGENTYRKSGSTVPTKTSFIALYIYFMFIWQTCYVFVKNYSFTGVFTKLPCFLEVLFFNFTGNKKSTDYRWWFKGTNLWFTHNVLWNILFQRNPKRYVSHRASMLTMLAKYAFWTIDAQRDESTTMKKAPALRFYGNPLRTSHWPPLIKGSLVFEAKPLNVTPFWWERMPCFSEGDPTGSERLNLLDLFFHGRLGTWTQRLGTWTQRSTFLHF